jgi:hypothetical protein
MAFRPLASCHASVIFRHHARRVRCRCIHPCERGSCFRRTTVGMRAGAAGSGTLTLRVNFRVTTGVLVVALPGGVCDLPSVMPLTTPKIITGAGVGTTTLRGSCGVGGIAAAGARVDARKIQNTCDTGQTRNKCNRLQTRAKGTRRAEQQKDIRKSTRKQ